MAPSTLLASPPLSDRERFALGRLESFYRLHAPIYDWTRRFLLFGRREAAEAVGGGVGDVVLDIGAGTGTNLEHLAAAGASVVGIEPSWPMRDQAERRLSRLDAGRREHIHLDDRLYGSHSDYQAGVAGILFSYSLSMIPPYHEVLDRARADLRPGGRLVVVDFLDAQGPVAAALRRSHVSLGSHRLDALRRLFPGHLTAVRRAGLWRYFLFVGRR